MKFMIKLRGVFHISPSGRLAFTFQIGKNNRDERGSGWRLQDVVRFLQKLGYSVEHAEDITEGDIEIGWKELHRRLSEQEEEFTAILCKDWVRNAHKEFAKEMQEMREGEGGNGRIVAIKNRRDPVHNTGLVVHSVGHNRLTTTEICLNLSPEDAIREFLNKWEVRIY